MKRYLAVGFTTTALASGFVALAAVATAAPTGPSQVDDTVRSLEAEGYNVVVNRTGDAPLSQCSVSAVRPGQTHSDDGLSRRWLVEHDGDVADRLPGRRLLKHRIDRARAQHAGPAPWWHCR